MTATKKNNHYCMECGILLETGKNCQDEFLDDFCWDCWEKIKRGEGATIARIVEDLKNRAQ